MWLFFENYINISMDKKDIAQLYSELNKNFLNENRHGPGAKDLPTEKKGKIKASSKGESTLGKAESSPDKADGFVPPEEADDRYNAKAKPSPLEESPNISTTKTEKKEPNSINRFMSTQSLFDKLYEEVMDDEDVLGIEAGPDQDDNLDEFEAGGDEDEVTLKLPRDLAEQLRDMLAECCGEDEDEDEDEDDNPFGEGVDFETVADAPQDSDMSRQVVAHKELVSSDDGDASYTDDVGEDGDLGHALVNPKKGHDGKKDLKNQKVKATRGSTPDSQAFGK